MEPEDQKLVTLARAAYGRAFVTRWQPAGAAVRDDTGRTYAAASVEVEGVDVTALQLAVAIAVSSGARRFEAGAVVTDNDDEFDTEGYNALHAFGDAFLIRARPDGTVVDE